MIQFDEIDTKVIFDNFKKINKVPRPSGNTKKISDFIENFGKELGLETYRDQIGNVLIKIEASEGYEDHESVIMQGHLDMVCIAENGLEFDFDNDEIETYEENGFIHAKGTTLGADDGIAVAMMMAILEDENLKHPKLEMLFTVDEETGMFGAIDFDTSRLEGKTLINVDSEDEGIITVSCAGGVRMFATFDIEKEKTNTKTYEVEFCKLLGGHSGCEIHKGRANAIKELARFLDMYNYQICEIDGGMRENAIPSEAKAIIVTDDYDSLIERTRQYTLDFKNRYKDNDNDLTIVVTEEPREEVFTKESSDNIICLINESPYGVVDKNDELDLVVTSLNVGVLKTNGNKVELDYSLRSSIDEDKEKLLLKVADVIAKHHGTYERSGDYSGWEYRESSRLRDVASSTYEKLYGEKAKVEAIHAGLECGIFAGKINDLDAISIGPNSKDVHTPNEVLDVESAKRTYVYVLNVLENL